MQVGLKGSTGQLKSLVEAYNTAFKLDLLQDGRALGDFLVPAELWPSPKLRSGTAALSDTLHWALAAPEAGTRIEIYEVDEEAAEAPEAATKICLLLQSGASRDDARLSLQARAASAEPAAQSAPESPAGISPAQRGQGRRLSVHATPPSMRARQATPVFTPPAQRAEMAAGESSVATSSGGAEQAGAQFDSHIAEAVHEALLGTGKANKRLLLSTVLLGRGVATVPFSHMIAGQLDGKTLAILQHLILQTLKGRCMLRGNLIRLPFLGLDIVGRLIDTGMPSNMPVRIQGCPAITILTGAKQHDQATIQDRHQLQYSQIAAKVAAHVVGGGEDGPAATAALQAAMAGERSLGASFSDLGGLQSQASLAMLCSILSF